MSDLFLAIGGVAGSAIAAFSAILLARKEDPGLRKSLTATALMPVSLRAEAPCAAFECAVCARRLAANWSSGYAKSARELRTDLNASEQGTDQYEKKWPSIPRRTV